MEPKKNETDEFLEAIDNYERIKKEEEAKKFAEEIGDFIETEPIPEISPEEYKDWWLKHISRIHKEEDKDGNNL